MANITTRIAGSIALAGGAAVIALAGAGSAAADTTPDQQIG